MEREGKKKRIRSCLVCREKFEQHQLKRFTWQNGRPKADENVKRDGRGVYCCRNQRCLERFMKSRKKLEKAFRI